MTSCLVPRREHATKHGDDDVEALVLDRQVLGIAFDPFNVDSRVGCKLTPGDEELWSQVDADDAASRLRGAQGCVACPACDIENVVAGRDPRSRDDALADGPELPLCDRGVVACRPARSCPLLEFFECAHVSEPRRPAAVGA